MWQSCLKLPWKLTRNHEESSNPAAGHGLQVTLAGTSSGVGASFGGSGESLALQVRQNVGGGAGQGTSVRVGNTGTTDVGFTGAGGTVGGKESTFERRGLENGVNVGEVVTFRQHVSTRPNLESMARVVVPVVVDCMQVGVVLDLRGTSTGLVQVVALEGHLVTGAIQVHVPVVMTIAGSGVVGFTVNVVVGD